MAQTQQKQEKLYTLRGRIGATHSTLEKGELKTLRFELEGSNGNKSLGVVNDKAIPYFLAAKEKKGEVLVKGHYRDFKEKNSRGRMVPTQRLEVIFVEAVGGA